MGFPTCKYRKSENGEIESEIFDSDEVPEGWADSPADLANGGNPVPPEHTEGLTDVSESVVKTKKKRRKRGD